ncbi:DnaT-like ssDNA-binding domain-containing protein [Spongiibacter nanhainus]|nr:DnaT-like ssDNA-binding domain-containing protein [Spongiibacter nanhainus]
MPTYHIVFRLFMPDPLLERPLLVSPTLAATLGLEAALLYQLLSDWLPLLDSHHRDGLNWQVIDKSRLETQLPFWDRSQIESTLRTLADQGLIVLGGALLDNAQNIRLALRRADDHSSASSQQPTPTSASQGTVSKGPTTRPPRSPVPGQQMIPADWRPDSAAVDYLTRFNGIEPSFIEASLSEFIAHYRETGEARSSWSSTFSQYVSRRWKRHQYQQVEQAKQQSLASSWRPSADALEILLRDGVTQHFIEDAIPEFILYWQERGTVDNNWNSRFIQHIRLQWARYRNTVGEEQEFTPMRADWQPSEAVFDILRMACIDADFARAQIPEFILYWRDSGQAQRSWNTKFLQHVKYRWAHSHQMGSGNARQQHATGPGQQATGFIEKHTDRSWAEGL